MAEAQRYAVLGAGHGGHAAGETGGGHRHAGGVPRPARPRSETRLPQQLARAGVDGEEPARIAGPKQPARRAALQEDEDAVLPAAREEDAAAAHAGLGLGEAPQGLLVGADAR